MIEMRNASDVWLNFIRGSLSQPVMLSAFTTIMAARGDERKPDLNLAKIFYRDMGEDIHKPFQDYLGGNMFVAQDEEDLTRVIGYDRDFSDKNGRLPNVTDAPLRWDVAEKIEDDYTLLFVATNNAGGDIYYIPGNLSEQARVDEHIRVTSEHVTAANISV